MAFASSFKPKESRNIIAPANTVAMGLAISMPAMSGAEP